jgi:hypothetical protein
MTPKERAQSLISQLLEKAEMQAGFKSDKLKTLVVNKAIEVVDNFLKSLQKMHQELNISVEPEDQYPYWIGVKEELEKM